ncbi:35698_t:CDS:2, partial [Racocetra persica]
MVRSLITLDEIVNDITRSKPNEVTLIPPAFNDSHDLATRVTLTYPLLARAIRLRERINTLVVYDIFIIVGMAQIYRTAIVTYYDIQDLRVAD